MSLVYADPLLYALACARDRLESVANEGDQADRDLAEATIRHALQVATLRIEGHARGLADRLAKEANNRPDLRQTIEEAAARFDERPLHRASVEARRELAKYEGTGNGPES